MSPETGILPSQRRLEPPLKMNSAPSDLGRREPIAYRPPSPTRGSRDDLENPATSILRSSSPPPQRPLLLSKSDTVLEWVCRAQSQNALHEQHHLSLCRTTKTISEPTAILH